MKIEMNGKKYYAQFDPYHARATHDRSVLLIDVGECLSPQFDASGVYWVEGTETERIEFEQWRELFSENKS
jgi:hypothetical protein